MSSRWPFDLLAPVMDAWSCSLFKPCFIWIHIKGGCIVSWKANRRQTVGRKSIDDGKERGAYSFRPQVYDKVGKARSTFLPVHHGAASSFLPQILYSLLSSSCSCFKAGISLSSAVCSGSTSVRLPGLVVAGMQSMKHWRFRNSICCSRQE